MWNSPPPIAQRFETRDLDELRAVFGSYGTHSRECVGRGELHVRWSLVRAGSASIGWGASSLGQRVRAATQVRLVHLPLGGPLTYRVGRRHFEAVPGRAMAIAPGTEYEVVYGPDAPALAFQVDERDLVRALRSRCAGELPARQAVREIALPGDAMTQLGGVMQPLWTAAEADRDVAADGVQSRLTSWLATLLAQGHGTTSRAEIAESRLRRLEEWIDEHLAEPLDLGLLCRIAGVEARGLRKSFLQRRGMPPMRWVASRRLAAARMRLLSASPSDSVIRIAVDHGMLHPGRFSTEYRRRYGESPSHTLGRSLQRT